MIFIQHTGPSRGRALPTEAKIESGTFQSKSGTSVKLSNSGEWVQAVRDEALERTFREQAIVNFCEPSYSSRSASGMRDVPQPADLIAIDTASVKLST